MHCSDPNLNSIPGSTHIRRWVTNVWESMGKPCRCMQLIKSRIFTTRIRISITSHMCVFECAMKLKVHMIKLLSPYSIKLITSIGSRQSTYIQCQLAIYMHCSDTNPIRITAWVQPTSRGGLRNFIICLTHTNVWESMKLQMHAVIKSCIFYYKLCENLYQYYKFHENPYHVLHVTCSD